jgi:HD-like signal output (HDOD) protein
MQPATLDKTDFAAQLRDDIAHNRLTLPTLPEVALRVREAVESDSANNQEIAAIVAQDAALSARLLQVANSPLYRGRNEIDSLQMAVTRLGSKLVRSLVISLAMKQIFQATSDALDRQFRRAWEDSLQVAAISRVLASALPQVETEQAMLAGLVHNIGALPVLARLDELLGFDAEQELIDEFVADLGPEVGDRILQAWNFPSALAGVPTGCLQLDRNPASEADYIDVVLVARLQHLAGSDHPDAASDWSQLPALAKVGLEPEVIMVEMEGPAEEIAVVRSMLEG